MAKSKVENPYVKKDQPIYFNLAQALLSGKEVSFTEMQEKVGGSLSPRSLGIVVRELTEAGQPFDKYRHPEYGTVYRMADASTAKPSAKKATKAAAPAAAKKVRKGMARGGKEDAPTKISTAKSSKKVSGKKVIKKKAA